MKNNHQHIETAVVSRSPGITYGHMYSMHRYWSKKSPDVVAAYIERYTEPEDIVLEPFCGSGVVACEAIRLGRRAIAIDINPMATFITKMTLTPINLSRLQWAFRDVQSACEEAVSELFVTTCYRCDKDAVVEFAVRDGDVPTQIAYRCTCSDERLFKEPDERDKSLDRSFEKKRIPFWYPCDVPIPIIQRERFQFLHELFTRRNLIALSTIFNAIEELEDSKIREVMKLAFTAALDKCSRLKPLSRSKGDSRPSLSEGWVAVRFYAPRMWQEVNPWHAFARSFERVYKGKKESNDKLKYAMVGSSYEELCTGSANVIIFTGSADTILNERLPEQSVDYILTDPPFGAHIQYLALSTFWGAWLKFDFDYDNELVVNRHRGKTLEDYEHHLGEILTSIRNVVRPNKYIHLFYHDIRGPYTNQRNQVRQSVLRRFQEKGITLDLIHEVEQGILDSEVKEHRTRRSARLLHLFGRELGFKCASANSAENEVVWEGDGGMTCSFRVTDKEILVKASQPLHGETIASEIGTISFLDLEDALWNSEFGIRNSELLNPQSAIRNPQSVVPPKHVLLKVLENRELCPKHHLITLQIPRGFNRKLQPGQFFHVICDPDGKKTLTDNGEERGYALTLRRPFSIHRVHYADFDRRLLAAPSILPYEIRDIVQRPVLKIDILYKVIGEGTRSLSQVRRGRLLDIIGPIGNGFNIERERTGVIVAGGIGVAPLVALAERLRYLGTKIHMYLGAVEQVYLQPILRDSAVQRGYIDGKVFCELIIQEFKKIGAETVKVCTDDGSVGEKGRVTDIFEADVEAGVIPSSDITIYACGPSKMMEKISDLSRKYEVPCQVLLEERMACGIGACFSCTCCIRGEGGKEEKKRVCIDGPVFNSEDIIW